MLLFFIYCITNCHSNPYPIPHVLCADCHIIAPRFGHSMVSPSTSTVPLAAGVKARPRELYVFGGFSRGVDNRDDLWRLRIDERQWTKVWSHHLPPSESIHLTEHMLMIDSYIIVAKRLPVPVPFIVW
jgi:hypothetical protein